MERMSELGLRERKKQRTRQALRQAAVRLFLERGFEATTIADIAAAADVAPRTFFSYFPTKEDVVLGEITQRFDRVSSELRQRPEGQPLLAAFRRAALAIADDLQAEEAQTDRGRAAARVILSTPAIQARIRDRMGQWEEELAAMIADERGAGPDDLESHVVAAALVGLLRSVQRAAVSAEMQLDLVPLMDHAFDLLESGLGRFAARA
jgi:AcrR family transcriptional regulator